MVIALKLVLTPALIATATILGRRFGHSFSGWLVGFPFTSAPISLFLAVEQGHSFAAAAAVGSVAGVLAQASFPLAYAFTRARGWPVAMLSGTVAFAAVAIAIRAFDAPMGVLVLADVAVLVVVLRLMPRLASSAGIAVAARRWDLPSRAVVATLLVLGLTAVAPLLGAFTSGVISGFPVYASVLAVFAHRSLGADAGAEVMRGLVAGLFGFATFFVVVALALLPLGLVPTYALASAGVIAVQSVALVLLRRAG